METQKKQNYILMKTLNVNLNFNKKVAKKWQECLKSIYFI